MRGADENPNGSGGVSITEVEAAFGRIPSVSAARVVAGPSGRITEVHVLAGRDRSPKQLVRDIQSVALTSFGLDIDYRTVSVVQLEDPGVGAQRSTGDQTSPAGARPALVRVTSEVAGHVTSVSVSLRAGDAVLEGQARGSGSMSAVLVCRATAAALAPTLAETIVEVGSVEFLAVADAALAVCVLRVTGDGGETMVSGSAPVRQDRHAAVARATLDALNRLAGRTRDLGPHGKDGGAGEAATDPREA